MKITIVMGFFLPMPPVEGGATEKSWYGLAHEFVRMGHEVTIISRRTADLPAEENERGLRHVRLPGHDHQRRRFVNLWYDLQWSIRVWRTLPAAEITVVNCVALPLWLSWTRRDAGRVVTMPGRMPKGQYRLYPHIDRVLAVSSATKAAILDENPRLSSITRVCGYPIAWSRLSAGRTSSDGGPVTIGFVGRLHREKGLDLLVGALALLAARRNLPAWRVVFCGPSDVARGGSGEAYAAALEQRLSASLPRDRFSILPPTFSGEELAALYQRIDIFCYPSIAIHGETFGVAVAEAMAAGAVPVVSRLACFSDLVRDGTTGRTFDHSAPDASAQLAEQLAALLSNLTERRRLSKAAREATRYLDFATFAERLGADFSTLK